MPVKWRKITNAHVYLDTTVVAERAFRHAQKVEPDASALEVSESSRLSRRCRRLCWSPSPCRCGDDQPELGSPIAPALAVIHFDGAVEAPESLPSRRAWSELY